MNSNDKPPIGLPPVIKTRMEEIRLDNTSGSVERAKKAAETLILLMDKIEVSSSSQLTACVEIAAKTLVKAQPAMASIFNLVNGVLLDIEYLAEIKEIRQKVLVGCQDFLKQLDKASRKISEEAAELIMDHASIITHSYSATVLNALLLAKKKGKEFDVICTESRPMKEGVYLAQRLAEEGINVKLVVDSAVFSLLPEAKSVFVGADALSLNGLVNKVGTLGLAIAAEECKTDFYALCSLDKILPVDYMVKVEDQKDPKEILSEAFDNVTPINYYFDFTPLDYLTGIITERGLTKPDKMKIYINNLKVHKVFSIGSSYL